ncbi:MAG: DUF5925 domain-containing protein, partial [Microthrixaceae bacterium]
AEIDNGLICVRSTADRCVIQVAAASPDSAAQQCREIIASLEPPPAASTVPLRVWHRPGPLSATGKDRSVDASEWDTLRRNYPTRTRERLDWLHRLRSPSGTGRLIIWHGEPGTGKTTAARSLFRSWSDWCATEYVSDPEQFLADTGYMNEVIGRTDPQTSGPDLDRVPGQHQRWRLIVAEDIDRVLGQTSGMISPGGLGRLLNLTDGVLGHGTRTLVLLTMNAAANRLEPALTRPGRAMSIIEFERFNRDEASEWLGEPAPTARPTLAELYHLESRNDAPGVTVEPSAPLGQYV